MKATLILRARYQADDLTIQRVVWRLPEATAERPHGLKYSLFCGRADGTCLARYDNETGKGDHRHYGDREEPYVFRTLTALLEDFERDVARLTGERG